MHKEIEQVYGHKVRVRVCGLCWEDDKLLLIDHQHLGPAHFWATPGGGIDFGVDAMEALKQEFLEETGLSVFVGDFLFTAELIRPPFHAIELFFEVRQLSGSLTPGHDPETSIQLINQLGYKSYEDILALPPNQRHGIFNHASTPSDLRKLRGYIRLL